MFGEVKICKTCGSTCDESFKFCPNCGSELVDSNCKNCGAALVEGAKFCVACGAPVHVCNKTQSELRDEPKKVKPVKVSKPKKPATDKKKTVFNIIKDVSLVVLCLVFFILSFCGVVTVDVDKYIEAEYDLKADIKAVDIISLMGASGRVDKLEDYQEIAEEDYDNFIKSLSKDASKSSIEDLKISDKTKTLMAKYFVSALKCELASEENIGSAMVVNIVIAGVLCLLSIFFSITMLIISIISLVLNLTKQNNPLNKFFFAMPVYLFASLLILFIVTTTLGFGTVVAGAMIANLFFATLALVGTVAIVFLMAKKKSVMRALPKLISVALCIVVCACMFAPFFTAKFDTTLKTNSKEKTYKASVGIGLMITYMSPSEIKELEKIEATSQEDLYNVYMTQIENMLKDLPEMTRKEFEEYVAVFYPALIMDNIVKAVGEYGWTGALSAGYYIVLFVFILLCAYSMVAISKLFSKKKVGFNLLIITLAVVIISLACSVGVVCFANYYLDEYEITNMSYTVGGGAIAGAVLLIITLIFQSVYEAVMGSKEDEYEQVPQRQAYEDELQMNVYAKQANQETSQAVAYTEQATELQAVVHAEPVEDAE